MAPAPPSAVEDFYKGLFGTSGVSLLGGLGLALLELLLCVVFVTPRRVAALDPLLLMRHARDDYARITLLALKLKQRPGALSVVYLGSSIAQRALYDSLDPAPIERRLTALVGEPITFYSLYASAETVRESELLVEQIPEGFRGLVTMVVYDEKDDDLNDASVLEQSPKLVERLALDPADPEEERVAFDGRAVRTTGNYFLDHIQFFSARRENLIHPWLRLPAFPRGGYHRLTPPYPGAEQVALERSRASPHALLAKYRELLETMIDNAQDAGASVVLVEGPANPKYHAMKGKGQALYAKRMEAFARRHGAQYWDLNPDLDLRRADFEDGFHLGDAGARLRFQRLYCQRVAAVLRVQTGRSETLPEDPADDEADAVEAATPQNRRRIHAADADEDP